MLRRQRLTQRQHEMLDVLKGRPDDWLLFGEVAARERVYPLDRMRLNELVSWGYVEKRKSETRGNRDRLGRGSKPFEYRLMKYSQGEG